MKTVLPHYVLLHHKTSNAMRRSSKGCEHLPLEAWSFESLSLGCLSENELVMNKSFLDAVINLTSCCFLNGKYVNSCVQIPQEQLSVKDSFSKELGNKKNIFTYHLGGVHAACVGKVRVNNRWAERQTRRGRCFIFQENCTQHRINERLSTTASHFELVYRIHSFF